MRKPSVVLAGVGVFVLVGALVFRLLSATPPHTDLPDASVVALPSDSDGGVADAGAGAEVALTDAGEPDAVEAHRWSVNPEVRLSNGDLYEKAQQAIDDATPGMTIFFPAGVYTQSLEVKGKKDLTLVSEGGPVYFWLAEDAAPAFIIIQSENISMKGFWLARDGDPTSSGMPNLLVSNSTNVAVSQLVSETSATCVSVVQSGAVVFDELAAFKCAGAAISVVDAKGDVTVARAKLSRTTVALSLSYPAGSVTPPHVRVSQSILAGTVNSDYPNGQVPITSSVIAAKPPVAEAAQRLGRPEDVEDIALTAPVTAADRARISEALARGKLVTFSASAGFGSEDFPNPPSTSFEWMLPYGDLGLAQAAVRQAAEDLAGEEPASGPVLVNVIGQPLPLCGRTEEIILYDAPGSDAEVGKLPSCETLSNDIGLKPELHTVTEQRGNWLSVGAGWMKKSEFASAELIEHGGFLIALPLFEAKVLSVKDGELRVAGDADVCLRATCQYEAEGSAEAEPPRDEEHTIELPPELKLPAGVKIQQLFSAACCT